MEIELLHTTDCHIWKESLKVLKDTLKNKGLEAEVKLTLIESQEQARERKFSGSPQINIDGKDVDPMSEKITSYNMSCCRQYFYKGKHSEYPPEEMILQALSKK